MEHTDKIFIAGHRGMVGSAIHRLLVSQGFTNLLCKTSTELDLRNQESVRQFFERERPAYVFLAAAKVGGIVANNTYRAEFLHDNLMIQNNVIHQAYTNQVKKLLFLGSSCIYPRDAPQPLREEYLLTGLLEPTNEPYAIAKIAGIKMCDAYRSQYGCNFISAMPTNLYGPNDNYDLEKSHVIPALLRKFHEAKKANSPTVTVWGSGRPLREFMHVDDLAKACLFMMEKHNEPGFLNVGTGVELTIADLASLVARVTSYAGNIVFDTSKPDGTYRKLMDSSRLQAIGWKPVIGLESGLQAVYRQYFNS
ncbi:MAG: GDP-L-fucose synthase [Cyclobacteriaceae bacterium]|nr:GDP-fucose synthetase [Cytophagales bacterium]HNP76701.1 GDP-L-fucose synthase [Cyclobacteriaceae bacterium]